MKGEEGLSKKLQWPWFVLAVLLLILVWGVVQRSRSEPNRSLFSRLMDTITAQPINRGTGSSIDSASQSAAGPSGPQGPKGEDGQQGPAGEAGQNGEDGSAGPAGANGSTGATGANGATGATGPQGATGAIGATGSQGPAGTASCDNGDCVSRQASSPGVQETGHINISGTVIANSFSGSGASLTSLNGSNISSGTVADTRLSTNVTIQGNSFNGVSQLVQTTGSGALPTLSAANLTNLNGSNISSGTVADARLSGNVTLQGNSFNGASQLVQLNGSTQLPAVSGVNLTNLNGSNIASGTVADARLSTNVTVAGNTFNGISQLVQTTAGGALPALSGVNLTSLNASNIASGTLADGRLSSNVPLINGTNNFSAANTFSAAGLALSVTNNATIGGTLNVTTSITIGSSGTALTQMRVYTPTLDPSSVAAASTAEQTYTVTGLSTSDTVYLNKPSLTTNCGIVNVRVSATNTLAVTWLNVNAIGACDPASEVYRLVAIRS